MAISNTVCPHCGTTTSISVITNSNRETGDAFFICVLRCQSCYKRFVALSEDNVSWRAIYPVETIIVADEISEPIKDIFKEANNCFVHGLYRACVVMCHITLEVLWRDKKVTNLQGLQDAGIITPAFRQRADEIRLWNNAIKHEAQIANVSREDCEELLAYMEMILDHVYVEPKRFERLQAKRKELKK